MIKNKKDLYKNLKKYFNEEREVFVSLHLNNKNKIVDETLITIGDFNGCHFDYSYLLDRSLKCNLNNKGKIVFAHSHTNKTLNPSKKDLETTSIIKEMGIKYKVNIVDYLIFNDKTVRSYKDDKIQ